MKRRGGSGQGTAAIGVAALAIAASLVASAEAARAQQPTVHRDIVYATVDGEELALDIHMPAGVESPPLLVWVHGGAWRSFTKESVPMGFVEHGIATASLDFRQTTDAPFPANVHDIKAGIRFLRRHASEYGYRTDRIAIGGNSSGGHLAALVGVTNDHPELEGNIGDWLGESSSVQAIVSYYGASNLSTILSQSTPHGLSVRVPALEALLGGLPEEVPEVAALASPVEHVDPNDPPLMLLHGDQDPQMPINQSHELVGVYSENGLDVVFDVVHGAGHAGPAFYAPAQHARVLEFLGRTIGQ